MFDVVKLSVALRLSFSVNGTILSTLQTWKQRLVIPSPETIDWSGFKLEGQRNIDILGLMNRSSSSMIRKLGRLFSQQHDVDRILPGRLVDLRKFSVSAPKKKARLIDTACIDFHVKAREHGFYSTLSYCWGDEKFYMVNEVNLESAHIELPYDDLPRTFQDAFQITKSLGINFLWIDALCILQGNVADWNRESAKMPYIYSRAAFCIAADSSDGANGGCFNKPGTERKEAGDSIKIRTTRSDGAESSLLVYKTNPLNSQPNAIQDGAVSLRGWTYQERILSPCILHYTSEQLFWECRHHYLAQDETVTWKTGHLTTLSARANLDYLTNNKSRSIISAWCREVIPEFSARMLTYPGDKLPALAGIARLYYGAIQVPYIAGIWLKDLGCGLGWNLDTQNPSGGTGQTRINSFSWISVDGPVVNNSKSAHLFGKNWLTIEDWNIQLESKHDPFGAVGPCSLTLKVLLKQATLAHSQHECVQCQHTWQIITADLPGKGDMEMGRPYMDTEEQARDVWCFPVAYSSSGSVVVLLVSPITPRDEGICRYRRIGILHTYYNVYRDYRDDSGMLHIPCRHCGALGVRQGATEFTQYLVTDDWFEGSAIDFCGQQDPGMGAKKKEIGMEQQWDERWAEWGQLSVSLYSTHAKLVSTDGQTPEVNRDKDINYNICNFTLSYSNSFNSFLISKPLKSLRKLYFDIKKKKIGL
ncbi:heterokaryon incompatibility protein-domain-containing protein [Apiosordaria backusii]|uniref:Heterokaryon incompatibility protein-domain-containing protein n=1 Tax=Apiosordaria backusii TaxID=314023 RepID=A0AA40E133_9PEZI|nr:heterokaryon incompatibility protein-domain-containing protein [Apiosordaria backusii]